LDDRGLATSYSDDQFHAVGTGKVVALIAYKALEDEPSSPLVKMERSMGVASRMTPKCDPPVHIWRVTAVEYHRRDRYAHVMPPVRSEAALLADGGA
jgi:hypothetical protein